ncbi:membrane protein insertase YidC [Gilvimarinus sp. F26214L]|uniref:membrane protein insertase YidC n=1 Tax=Gilvimarinus sp. DZF01 TaxID=3461371 RepID=UPI0040463A5F
MKIETNVSDWLRTTLLIAMAGIALMLVIEWGEFQEARRPKLETSTTLSDVDPVPAPADTSSDAPVPSDAAQEIPQAVQPEAPAAPQAETGGAQLITVHTGNLEVVIDTHGGDIVKAALPQHDAELNSEEPLVLLNRNRSMVYIAQSGLVGRNGTDLPNGERPVYSVAQSEYRMPDNADTLTVDLSLEQGDVTITKRFIFHKNENLVDLNYLVDNQGSEPWLAHLYGQIKRDDHNPSRQAGFGMRSFLGVATTRQDENYQKYDFEDIADQRVNFERTGGWVAMVQHYFISAWIPAPDESHAYSFRKLPDRNQYLFGFTGPAHQVQPGQQDVISAQFYAGPKDINRLDEIAPYLERTIDYGPLWFICLPLFYFLSWIHGFVGNWGVAIILLVVAVKAAFFHLSAAGFRSMAKMRKFAPRMQELKERYGDNRQKFSEEMIKLYKKEKINPMKGCLPMLLQMPVFIALYWVLMESVELRHAPFLWIADLSVKDPFYILPLIYGATFWFQMKLNPPAQDPTQQKVMQMMPVVFTVMFMFFPAGLVLYWVVNGALSIAQQWFITRQIEKGEAKA